LLRVIFSWVIESNDWNLKKLAGREVRVDNYKNEVKLSMDLCNLGEENQF
jgi:hypothetical protein